MPLLVSSRKFINRALSAVSVDTKGKQPNVTDAIQLVYVLENVGEQLFAHGSVGDFTPNLGGGLHHILQGECRNPRGMIIQEVIGAVASSTGGIQSCNVGTAAVSAPISFPIIEPIGIQEGLPVRAEFISGGVTGAFFATTLGFYRVDIGEPIANLMNGLFVGFGRFFMIVSSNSQRPGEWSVRWKELSD